MSRGQRLILFVASILWLIADILVKQRDFQDEWILNDIFWPFAAFIAVFMLVLMNEEDNRVTVVLCSLMVAVIAIVPSLKYQQPYGSTNDAVAHYSMTASLVTTSRVISNDIYASMPGMHAWLASLALMGGFSAEEAIRFGLPLTAAILPAIIYWLCRRSEVPDRLTKYTVAASCLAVYPYHLPTGTGFALVPLVVLLGALMIREFYVNSNSARTSYGVIALLGLAQLTIWHTTTPLILPVVLVVASFSQIALWHRRRSTGGVSIAGGLLRFSLLAATAFIGYMVLKANLVFEVLISTIQQLITGETGPESIVPLRILDLGLLDVMRLITAMHGRDVVLIGLSALGLLVVFNKRSHKDKMLFMYAYFVFVCIAFAILIPATSTGIAYRRLLWVPLAISPLFVGPALWWLHERYFKGKSRATWIFRSVGITLVVLLIGISMIQFYSYQPLVPTARAISPETSEEYIVWLHMANSAYQERMMHFAESHTYARTRFATDYWGGQQFERYFGDEAVNRRGLYLPFHQHEPVDPNQVDLLLLHWPGAAGGMGEQVENRSIAKLTELRNTEGWDLIYDNGESFLLRVR